MTETLALLGAGVIAGWSGKWLYDEFRREWRDHRRRQQAAAVVMATQRQGISEWENTPAAPRAVVEQYRRQSTREEPIGLYDLREPGEPAPTVIDLPAVTDDDLRAWGDGFGDEPPTEPGYHRRLPKR